MLAGQTVKAQAEKGILWSFAAEEGFCFVTAALLSAVTVLKVHANGSCAFAVVTLLFSHSPCPLLLSTLLQ